MNKYEDLLLKSDDPSIIREYFLLRQTEVLDMNFGINLEYFTSDIELLERVVRFIVRTRLTVPEMYMTVVVRNCDEVLKDYIEWFVKFFGYLESVGKEGDTNAIEDHKNVFDSEFATYKFDLDNMHFKVNHILVLFQHDMKYSRTDEK